jgi:phosphotransferase system enzyme I (PtsI)
MTVLQGLGVSSRAARGRALVVRPRRRQVFYLVAPDAVEGELGRLAEARRRSRVQLEEIRSRVARAAGSGPASLFEAQLQMLEDPLLLDRTEQLVRGERRNAEWALQHVAGEFTAMLEQAEDAYLRERHGDLRDVVGRLVLNLRGEDRGLVVPDSQEPWALIADELPPSMAAQVDWHRVHAFVTEVGSWTYHTAILARSLGIAAVVGVADATRNVPPGADVLVDGNTGEVLLGADDRERHRRIARPDRASVQAATAAGTGIVRTADHVEILLGANIELPDEIDDALTAGAQGIGLFRSEFLLSERGAPEEGAQTEVYRDLLGRSAGEVTVRTFDAKPNGTAWSDQRAGPRGRLGLRALAVDADFRAQFETQVRALLRASPTGRLRILLPFITDVDEVRLAKAIVRRASEALGVPPVPLGAMIEVPSAALTADRLAEEVDFLSIGTNDLIALTLAVERVDERTSRFYAPLHPSIVRLLLWVTRAATRRRKRLAVCGEMAADPQGLLVLLGLGVTELSMAPAALSRARRQVAQVSRVQLRPVVRRLLRQDTSVGRELAALAELGSGVLRR